MQSETLEEDLNNVIEDLHTGLLNLADKIRNGATRDELANLISDLGGIICEHWPDCLSNMKKQPYCSDDEG